MKKITLIMIVLGIFGIESAYAQVFTLKSMDLGGQLTENQVFSGFGCTGKNISTVSHLDECAPRHQKLCLHGI